MNGIRELKARLRQALQDRALARMASDGSLRVAERQRRRYGRSPIKSHKGLARQLIDEDRAE